MEKFPIEAERLPLPTFRRGETASPIGEIIDGRPFRRYPLSRIFSLDLDDIKIGARYPRIVRINFLDVDGRGMTRNVCIPFRLLARGNSSTRVIRNVTR